MSGANRPTTVRLVQLQVRATSPDGSMNRNTGDIEQPRCANTGELGYPRYQMLPCPYIRDAYIFTYLEQLENLVRLITPGAEAKLYI